jgi:hypothetical protein
VEKGASQPLGLRLITLKSEYDHLDGSSELRLLRQLQSLGVATMSEAMVLIKSALVTVKNTAATVKKLVSSFAD